MSGPTFSLTQYGGTLTTTAPFKVSLTRRRGHGLIIQNREAAGGNNMEVSFDAGHTWFLIRAGTDLNLMDGLGFYYFYVRAVATNVTWSAIVKEG